MSSSISFHSEELQQVFSSVAPVLGNLENLRNSVSQDIRSLEDYLQHLDLKVPFRLYLGKGFVPPDDQAACDVKFALEEAGSASGEIQEESLAWDQDKSGKFRLHYELNRWNGYVDIDAPGGPFFWSNETHSRQSRPLIETKFEVRQRLYKELPRFLRELTKHLAGDLVKVEGDCDSIPF